MPIFPAQHNQSGNTDSGSLPLCPGSAAPPSSASPPSPRSRPTAAFFLLFLHLAADDLHAHRSDKQRSLPACGNARGRKLVLLVQSHLSCSFTLNKPHFISHRAVNQRPYSVQTYAYGPKIMKCSQNRNKGNHVSLNVDV